MIALFKKLLSSFTSPSTSPYVKNPSNRPHTSARYGGMGERELELRMEMILEEGITDPNRKVFNAAKQLASFGLIDQERFLAAVQRINTHNRELAYQFCHHGIKALRLLPESGWEKWLTAIEQQLRKTGCSSAVSYMKNLEQYLKETSLPPQTVYLDDIAPILERLLTAFSGRQLSIKKAQEVYTDTETIYLPESCSHYANQEDNFALYKIWTVYQWAQSNFGTWDIYSSRLLNQYAQSDSTIRLFQILENIRLDACIARELPGIARWLDHFGKQTKYLPTDKTWQTIIHKLSQAHATANDSLQSVESLRDTVIPEVPIYQGTIKPPAVEQTITNRVAENKQALQQTLDEYLQSLQSLQSEKKETGKWSLSMQDGSAGRYEFELNYDDTPMEITPDMQQLLESIMQDLREVPQEYLQVEQGQPKKDLDTQVADPMTATALLPEWDYSINKYRQDWCRVFLRPGLEGDDNFTNETLAKYHHVVKRLKHTFEALREGDIRQKRQSDGDEMDLDAAIQSIVDIRSGASPEQNIYIRNRKEDRNIAVMFMVDISGSTSGWINHTEKEALILLCEALETLGDRYAIYGFSTQTRNQCDIFELKSFDEAYSRRVSRKIAGLKPTGYTRLGAAIRFLSRELLKAAAKTRILITLSDGKPDDKDGYRGAYGIEDTRRAILEASFKGIHPYCITIDTHAKDYLPYMYSHANFSIINAVEKLPFKVSDIYRKITS